jgi:hypothetical protein
MAAICQLHVSVGSSTLAYAHVLSNTCTRVLSHMFVAHSLSFLPRVPQVESTMTLFEMIRSKKEDMYSLGLFPPPPHTLPTTRTLHLQPQTLPKTYNSSPYPDLLHYHAIPSHAPPLFLSFLGYGTGLALRNLVPTPRRHKPVTRKHHTNPKPQTTNPKPQTTNRKPHPQPRQGTSDGKVETDRIR